LAWAPFCGDIAIQATSGEECDDGLNNGAPLGCMPDCTLPQNCGDARVAASRGETCDDGNTCSSTPHRWLFSRIQASELSDSTRHGVRTRKPPPKLVTQISRWL
jgi:hypothetical protein